jgi:hypothetical protein
VSHEAPVHEVVKTRCGCKKSASRCRFSQPWSSLRNPAQLRFDATHAASGSHAPRHRSHASSAAVAIWPRMRDGVCTAATRIDRPSLARECRVSFETLDAISCRRDALAGLALDAGCVAQAR